MEVECEAVLAATRVVNAGALLFARQQYNHHHHRHVPETSTVLQRFNHPELGLCIVVYSA